MAAQPLFHSPELAISSRALPFPHLDRLRKISALAGLDGIGLDLTNPLRTLTSHVLRAGSAAPAGTIRSVWASSPGSGVFGRRWSAVDLADSALSLRAESLVVVPPETGIAPRAMIGLVDSIRRIAGPELRVLFAIRSARLRGGRPHLVELTAIRHLAEEWEFGLALDLTGRFDPSWEAEAAVLRLGSRLELVSARTDATDSFPIDRSRVAARAIAAALDRDPPPRFLLVPSVPFWQRASLTSLAESAAAAAAKITARAAAIDPQRSALHRPNAWPNPRG